MKPLFAALLLCLIALPIAAADRDRSSANSLKEQIETIARDHGFHVHGTEVIRVADPVVISGPIDQVLARLLAEYNFITVRDASGGIVSINVVGERANDPHRRETKKTAIRTERDGSEHYVNVDVSGPSGHDRRLRMLVDTGATTVVLPLSMTGELGFTQRSLKEVAVQTANGLSSGHMATLKRIQIGDVGAKDVAVTFVPDEQLGGKTLLGMSFLGRFIVTIDDATNEIRLHDRPNSGVTPIAGKDE